MSSDESPDDIDEIVAFLSKLRLQQYAVNFKDYGVEKLEDLKKLSEEDLGDDGVGMNMNDKKVFIQACKALGEEVNQKEQDDEKEKEKEKEKEAKKAGEELLSGRQLILNFVQGKGDLDIIFQRFDKDGNGFIDDEELEDLIYCALCFFCTARDPHMPEPPREQCDPFVKKIILDLKPTLDENDDGVISREEFELFGQYLNGEYEKLKKEMNEIEKGKEKYVDNK